MAAELIEVSPPEQGVYRIGWRSSAVFAPPSWDFADPNDGTFGNRFDDPGHEAGHSPEQQFRMVYCATERICTLMESCARFRQSLPFLGAFTDDELSHLSGVIPAEWRLEHVMGHTRLDSALRFVDIAAMSTMSHLRDVMAKDAFELGLEDFDLSVVTGPHRKLTQHIARHIHEQVDTEGRPRFAGIRYLSRFGDNKECWAVFDTRIKHGDVFIEQNILPDDDDLLSVARVFGLTIEVLDGHYLRP